MKIRSGILLCAVCCLSLLLLSCRTVGTQVSKVPSWITIYPDDPNYYIGIGSSNTGDRSADMDAARSKALSNLSASISTHIQSEQTSVSRADSAGGSYEAAESLIKETVNQNLKEVETAGSYYSEKIGGWMYLRISKQKWREIQDKEMLDLGGRIVDLVQPVLDDAGSTVASRLSVLWKAWGLLSPSPYAEILQSTLGGESGTLIDLIERSMVRYIDSLSIHFNPAIVTVQPGKPVTIGLTVQTTYQLRPGSFAVRLVRKDDPSVEVVSLTTLEDGRFKGEIQLPGFGPGKTSLVAELSFKDSGIDLDSIRQQFLVPSRDVLIDEQQAKAGLSVAAPPESKLTNLYEVFRSLLSSKVPLAVGVPSADDRFTIRVTLRIRNAPENEYGIVFAYLTAYFSVEKGSRTLYSYESAEFKGGGLDVAQGQKKALDALLEGVAKDSSFRQGMLRALTLD